MSDMTAELNAALRLAGEHIKADLLAKIPPPRPENTRPIVTSHVYPPIPIRDYDWSAHFDDVGADCSPYGWGATEAEAIADLLDNYGDDGEADIGCMRLPDR